MFKQDIDDEQHVVCLLNSRNWDSLFKMQVLFVSDCQWSVRMIVKVLGSIVNQIVRKEFRNAKNLCQTGSLNWLQVPDKTGPRNTAQPNHRIAPIYHLLFFLMFSIVKSTFKRHCFDNLENIKHNVTRVLNRIPVEEFLEKEGGINGCQRCWQQYINTEGYYFQEW